MSASFDFGMVGLGVMGRNLLLNLADHNFGVAGLDTNQEKVQALKNEGAAKKVDATTDAKAFVAMLTLPRVVMLLVPAGKAVDSVLTELSPLLSPGDLVIDAGNSHFKDTDRRAKEMAAKGLHFFGMGVSGGEAGARRGPAMMPGGPKDAYERVRPMFDAIAAKVNGEPCVAWCGPGSAGNYVKMVHNGIEYGLMQILGECYDIMRRGLGMSIPQIQKTFAEWNQGPLASFLVEITAKILTKTDPKTGKHLVEVILDVARGKGTGKWTTQEAAELQSPFLAVEAAVAMRDLSGQEAERAEANRIYGGPSTIADATRIKNHLENACLAAFTMTYAQGFGLLRKASAAYGYQLELETIARIWRGGCIIRAAFLETIRQAYKTRADLPHLMLDAKIAESLKTTQGDLREVLRAALGAGIPAAALSACLQLFDAYRSGQLPTNLVQAQRDFFGAHTYERVDEKGSFHTKWEE
ncbi:MAG: NADP-dependent phosphogluconate dehydrogenase [Gemmataceae bacterium]|nr:NADP-dependent phosphogluconate dehydrogenase [Gemmataceae bacterium]